METADIAARLSVVLARHPLLTYAGFTEFSPEFQAERDRMLTDDALQQIAHCLRFLQLVRRARSALPPDEGPATTSDTLKLSVRSWLEHQGLADRDAYVAVGPSIAAAIIGGVRISRKGIGASRLCYVALNSEDLLVARRGKNPTEWRKAAPFVRWLIAQAGRGDPVGDLGEDVRGDMNFPRRGPAREIRAYLASHGAHVVEAYDDARREYRTR
jgi:hypothetical protein